MISVINTSQPPESDPDSDKITRSKVFKLLRCESPEVTAGQNEIELVTKKVNQHVAIVVDLIKRWWDGGFGTAVGEDKAKAQEMQHFAAFALEHISSKVLIEVFSHLTTGTRHKSCTGTLSGNPEKRLAAAKKQNEQNEVQKIEAYLKVVGDVTKPDAFLPLGFITAWRKQLGSNWVDLILNEAAQHLRSHVKALQTWEANEAERKRDLQKFENSKVGKQYLAAKQKYFPAGIPRNRDARKTIYSNQNLVQWRNDSSAYVAGSSLEEIFEKNPELVKLRNEHTKYERLIKPFTIPAWKTVSDKNLRWPFLDRQHLKKEPVWDANSNKFILEFPIPDFNGSGDKATARIALTDTPRLSAVKTRVDKWKYQWIDEITGQTTQVAIKGVRFEQNGTKWLARISYEKIAPQRDEHTAAVLQAAFNKEAAPVQTGDIVCVYSLEPRGSRSRGNQTRRSGILRVVGIGENGQHELLASGPIDSFSHVNQGRRAIRRGVTKFQVRDTTLTKPQTNSKQTSHGPTRGVSLPQMLDVKRNIDRELRLLRLVKDPERREEALDRVNQKLVHLRRTRDPGLARWEGIAEELQNSQKPTDVQLLPIRERLKDLRNRLAGMKANYRHAVAKELLRTVHEIRIAKDETSKAGKFRKTHKNGAVFLVTEFHKGRGPGPLRGKVLNKTLAVLGPAKIYESIVDKAGFMTPEIPVATISPKSIRKDCPECAHTHAKSASDSDGNFNCKKCGHIEFVTTVAVKNLAKRFFAPSQEEAEDVE